VYNKFLAFCGKEDEGGHLSLNLLYNLWALVKLRDVKFLYKYEISIKAIIKNVIRSDGSPQILSFWFLELGNI
jgi:hypothetical protein